MDLDEAKALAREARTSLEAAREQDELRIEQAEAAERERRERLDALLALAGGDEITDDVLAETLEDVLAEMRESGPNLAELYARSLEGAAGELRKTMHAHAALLAVGERFDLADALHWQARNVAVISQRLDNLSRSFHILEPGSEGPAELAAEEHPRPARAGIANEMIVEASAYLAAGQPAPPPLAARCMRLVRQYGDPAHMRALLREQRDAGNEYAAEILQMLSDDPWWEEDE